MCAKTLSRLEKLKIQLTAIDMLRLLKQKYTYEQLCDLTGIPVTVLNRYVKGRVLPNEEKAREIISMLEKKFDITAEIRKKLKVVENNIIDTSAMLADMTLLKKIGERVVELYGGKKIDVVLTSAVDGIPVATHIATMLGSRLAIAKKYKNLPINNYISTVFMSGDVSITLYVPKGRIKRNNNVLIVDDIIIGGSTQSAMIKLVKNCKANIVGVFCVIAVGLSGLKKIRNQITAPINIMVELEERE